MRVDLITFTQKGAVLAALLAKGLEGQGDACAAYAMPRHAAPAGNLPLEQPLARWTEQAFCSADALVFISASGVAVRAIAPYLKGKLKDPAVIVLDDNARFAVSLLSGHVGGANKLAARIAQITGAQAVISTATDGAGLFSVDSWAKQNGCALWELPQAKAVSAALLDGEPVCLSSAFPVEGALPEGFAANDVGRLGVCISLSEQCSPFATTLHLIPRALMLGIGCKRGTTAGAIAARVEQALQGSAISPRAVCGVASAQIKADEPGLLEYCAQQGISPVFYSPEQLMEAEGEFASSDFVRGVTGADNICERAAVLLAGEGGTLLIKKQAGDGVTVAAALRDWRVRF